MKFIFVIFLTFFVFSCEKTQLFPVTAEVLLEKISSFKGKKAVLINIWALWCEPCVEEFPMIVNLQKKTNDLEVIFVNVDFEDQFQDVINFLNGHSVGEVSYVKRQKDEIFINGVHHNWSGSLPFTLIYAKKSGKLVDYWEGKKPLSKFTSVINKAINS